MNRNLSFQFFSREAAVSTKSSSDVKNDKLSTSEIIDNILTLILAGSDTTASTAVSSWIALSSNPSLKARIRTACEIGDEEIVDRFLEMVLESSPPVPFNFRETTKELTVGDYRVPANWLLAYGFAAPNQKECLDRDWIQDLKLGQTQDKTGDNDSNTTTRQPRATKLVAFGAGQRKCPGRFLANMELRMLVKELVLHDWELKPGQRLEQLYTPGYFPKDKFQVRLLNKKE